MVVYTPLDTINQENIVASIKRNAGFSCTVPYSNQETEGLIANILQIIFNYLSKPELGSSLVYFIRELVMNASKANSKRVYFAEKGLNISDPSDYQAGIMSFKREVFSDFGHYAPKLKEQGYFVRIDFKIDGEVRIHERLRVANRFTTMEEIFAYGFDDTEGGGFGLIIGILMLRKVGLDENVFTIDRDDHHTAVILRIPLNLLTKEQGLVIAQEIVTEIERMPQFPESIVRLTKNLNDPNADFNSVAAIIRTDPSLTTEIIRIANSPIYMLPKKVSDPATAVKMIGLAGVKSLVLSHGVNQVFSKRYKKEKIDQVMEHSYRVALYCSQIAKQKKMDNLLEDIYVAALLHDFGKIITNSLQPGLIEKLNEVCRDKSIPITSLEDLTQGYNHAIIGSLLAEKWNFPDKFVQCIKYHHMPLEGSGDYKAIIYTCYLGNELDAQAEGRRSFHDLNYQVLKFFGLEQEDRYDAFVKRTKKALNLA
jgi:putative nucleotidyltransferase with HDIG domain